MPTVDASGRRRADRSVTGFLTNSEVQSLIQPSNTAHPPLSGIGKIRLGNLLLIKFEVASALEVHRVAGGRSFYRISTETPTSAEQIQTLREAKRSVFYERQQPLNAGWDDLDQTAIAALTARLQDSRALEVVLAHSYHLVDKSRGRPTPNMAGLLLLAREPNFWHPRCGIDFVKYEGPRGSTARL
jgi:predicted HTH transcriptional regulator